VARRGAARPAVLRRGRRRLFLAVWAKARADGRHWRRPDVARRRQERIDETRRRRAFWADYGRFLHAAIAGDGATVRSLLDAGLLNVAPSPGTVPRYPREWVEATVETTVEAREIRGGLSIFRHSALELVAWYGHAELVALLAR
jgi:hypothetical protein